MKPRAGFTALAVVGISVGLLIFAVGAMMLDEVALLGIVVAAIAGVGYVWRVHGREATLRGIAAAVIGSSVAWLGARVMMRTVALSSGIEPELTFLGTLNILGVSFVLGILPAMGYLIFARRFGHKLKTAAGYGAILALLGGLPLIVVQLSEISSVADVPAIPIGFLLVIPFVFAVTLELAIRGFHRL